MLFLRARWYSVRDGRFVSQDPWSGSIQQPQTLHKYVYVLNNAVNHTDPSGYTPLWLKDHLGRRAVRWYRSQYKDTIILHSQQFQISAVELEAALYTMGGEMGFVADRYRRWFGIKQDQVWRRGAFLLRYWARGFEYPCAENPVIDHPLARQLEDWGRRAARPSIGIAEMDPPTMRKVEAYWKNRGGPDLSPPIYARLDTTLPSPAYVTIPRDEWITDPHKGIQYLAAYVGWCRRELERFTTETGGSFTKEKEWWFIGKMLNGGSPTAHIGNLIEKSRSEGVTGVASYWASKIAPENQPRTGTLYVKYMRSPEP
jgi:hypothetical protein